MSTSPHERMIDPRQAVALGQSTRSRANAQEVARQLLEENARLMKVLGLVLEKVGPVELDEVAVRDAGLLYEVEKYDSHDGLSARWVGKRVAG